MGIVGAPWGRGHSGSQREIPSGRRLWNPPFRKRRGRAPGRSGVKCRLPVTYTHRHAFRMWDPSRPEGPSGGQPLRSVVKIKNDEPQRAQRITGINWRGSTMEGHAFRRAVHLIWRAHGTRAEESAGKRTFKYRSG